MRTAVTLILSLALVACGTSTSGPRQAPELTDEYGCSFGFYLGAASR